MSLKISTSFQVFFLLFFSVASAQMNPALKPFYHGVASGDPLEDRVIIWTRVTPDDLSGEAVEVNWKIATDPELRTIVNSGATMARADRDYTVKLDVTGLTPGTTYYYGFSALEANSLTGRTKTTPVGDAVDHLKFGVLNCANFQSGYFNAYHNVASLNDLDAIIFLGDYFYETPERTEGDTSILNNRPIEPKHELITMEDYRLRYSTYRLDTALVRAHQQHAFIPVWDDHESANNSWTGGASNHNPATEGDWEDRKTAAKKAYFEWMPVREMPDQRNFKKFQYGDLVDLLMIDTRLEGRNEQIYNAEDPALQDPDRTILGENQKSWLTNHLMNSTAKWKIIGNQVIFSKFNTGWLTILAPQQSYYEFESLSLDSWQGYPAEQLEIFNFIRDNNIQNVVITTGDIHVGVGSEVVIEPNTIELVDTTGLEDIPIYTPSETYNPETGEGAIAVEFISPSITSSNFDEIFGALAAQFIQGFLNREITTSSGVNIGNPNPHIKYADLTRHGYYILDVKRDSVQANWYYCPINQAGQLVSFDKAFYSLDGTNHLLPAAAASPPKVVQDLPAPSEAPIFTSTKDPVGSVSFLGLYPNPFRTEARLHYALENPENLKISLYNSQGIKIKELMNSRQLPGIYLLRLDASELAPGMYYLQFESDQQLITLKGLKLD